MKDPDRRPSIYSIVRGPIHWLFRFGQGPRAAMRPQWLFTACGCPTNVNVIAQRNPMQIKIDAAVLKSAIRFRRLASNRCQVLWYRNKADTDRAGNWEKAGDICPAADQFCICTIIWAGRRVTYSLSAAFNFRSASPSICRTRSRVSPIFLPMSFSVIGSSSSSPYRRRRIVASRSSSCSSSR